MATAGNSAYGVAVEPLDVLHANQPALLKEAILMDSATTRRGWNFLLGSWLMLNIRQTASADNYTFSIPLRDRPRLETS